MATEQPELRPKKVDLDLLPDEYKPRKVSKLTTVLVIVVILMVCLAGLLIYLKTDADSKNSSLEGELATVTSEYQKTVNLVNEGKALQTQIDAAESKLEAIEQDYLIYQENLILWSVIIKEIDDAIPGTTRLSLKSITQSGVSITLLGTADEDSYIWNYATNLEEKEYFWDVTPTSIVSTGASSSFTITMKYGSGGGQ
jgi:Tfp pilus assembly protein PilN